MAKRNTWQREAVREALDSRAGFVSAQALHSSLHEAGTSIGLATVYRALADLAERGEDAPLHLRLAAAQEELLGQDGRGFGGAHGAAGIDRLGAHAHVGVAERLDQKRHGRRVGRLAQHLHALQAYHWIFAAEIARPIVD